MIEAAERQQQAGGTGEAAGWGRAAAGVASAIVRLQLCLDFSRWD